MAGIKLYKLKAATLMETLVAITIIMTVFSVCTMVFLNVTGSSYTGEKINSMLMLNEISFETKKEKTFFDEEIKKDNIIIRKQIDKYNGQKNLFLLHLSAYNESNKLLAERKEILLVEDE